jgi:hypothetical protein
MSFITAGPNAVSEIQAPFSVDSSTGAIGIMSDPVQVAIQHIMAVLFIAPGELVMNPNYGVGLQNLVFENMDDIEFQAVAIEAQQQLQQTDGTYYDVTVTAAPSPSNPGTYVFQVSFQIYADAQTHYAIFDTAGNVIGES